MFKFRKVYICDCCGKVEAPRYSGKPYFLHRRLPLYWEKIAGKTLCSNCADSYKIYKAMTYAKERIFFDNGVFIPYAKYEVSEDFANDQMIVRKVK